MTLIPQTIEVTLTGAYEKTYPDVFVLQSTDDIFAAMGVRNVAVEGDIKKALKSPCPDHEAYGAEVTYALTGAFLGLDNEEWWNRLDRVRKETAGKQLEKLDAGRHVILNQRGGWFDIDPDDYDIVSSDPDYWRKNVDIRASSTKMLLENDASLDEWYEGMVRLQRHSRIVNLRELTEDNMVTAFNEFFEAGGAEIVVYTQALDVEQITTYMRAFKHSSVNVMKVYIPRPLVEVENVGKIITEHGGNVILI